MSESEQESKKENKEKMQASDPIDLYLSEGKSFQYVTINGVSSLMYACVTLDEELGVRLVTEGVGVDCLDPWDHGITTLHVCAQMDLCKLFQCLLLYFRNQYLESSQFNSFLIQCVTSDKNIQFNSFESGGRNIAHYAAQNGNTEILKLIAEKTDNDCMNALKVSKDWDHNTPFDLAVTYNHFECAQYLNPHCTEQTEFSKMHKTLKHKIIKDSQNARNRFGLQNTNILESQMSQVHVIHDAFSVAECNTLLNTVIAYTDTHSWSTDRHRSYATTDIPSAQIGLEFDAYVRELVALRLFPSIIKAYKLNNTHKSIEHKDYRFNLGFRDLFFVKYEVVIPESKSNKSNDSVSQVSLPLHRDGSLVSFNVLLNLSSEFEGGGTLFPHLSESGTHTNGIVQIEKGSAVIHSGRVLHGGNAITSGVRYILVGFLDGAMRHVAEEFEYKRIKSESYITTQTRKAAF